MRHTVVERTRASITATMANKVSIKTTFEAARTIEPIYTGGGISLDRSGRLLATTVEEDALIVDLKTGEHLTNIEGVCVFLSAVAHRHKCADN